MLVFWKTPTATNSCLGNLQSRLSWQRWAAGPDGPFVRGQVVPPTPPIPQCLSLFQNAHWFPLPTELNLSPPAISASPSFVLLALSGLPYRPPAELCPAVMSMPPWLMQPLRAGAASPSVFHEPCYMPSAQPTPLLGTCADPSCVRPSELTFCILCCPILFSHTPCCSPDTPRVRAKSDTVWTQTQPSGHKSWFQRRTRCLQILEYIV